MNENNKPFNRDAYYLRRATDRILAARENLSDALVFTGRMAPSRKGVYLAAVLADLIHRSNGALGIIKATDEQIDAALRVARESSPAKTPAGEKPATPRKSKSGEKAE